MTKTLSRLAVLLAALCTLGYAQTTQPTTQQVDAAFDSLTQAGQQLAAMGPKLRAAYDAAVSIQPAVTGNVATTRPFLAENSSANDYYLYCRWADITRNASQWYNDTPVPATTPSTPTQPPLQFNAHGIPTGASFKAHSLVYALGCPAGKYTVSWTGNGAPAFSVWGGSYQQTGPNSGIITLPQENAWVNGQWGWSPNEIVTISLANTNIDDLHIWRPGYGPGSSHEGQMYCDEDLEIARKFCAVRAMNDLKTSDVIAGKWANRVHLTDWDWSSYGIPLDAVIEEAKEAGVPALWISIPAEADDEWVTNAAQMLHDRFHGKVYIEGPNESWNTMGMVGNIVLAGLAGDKGTNCGPYDGNIVNGKWVQTPTGSPFVTDSYTREARCAADQQSHVSKLFLAIYADRPDDCQPMFAGCSADPRWITIGMQFLVARDGSHPFKNIAIAPYIDFWAANGKYWQSTGPNNTPVLADLFSSSERYLSDTNQPGIPWQLAQGQALARQYGVKLLDYEGGQSFMPELVNNQYTGVDLSTQAQTDPRMGAMYDQYFALLHQYGVAMHCDFLPIGGPWNRDGFWSDLGNGYSDVSSPNCVRWQALMRESRKSN